MIHEGQTVLFRFPRTDQEGGKLRPALVLRKLPGRHGDWLVCMISSQMDHQVPGFDDIIRRGDDDFFQSGLKNESVIRIARVAVVEGRVLVGAIGEVQPERLTRIQSRLARWLEGR